MLGNLGKKTVAHQHKRTLDRRAFSRTWARTSGTPSSATTAKHATTACSGSTATTAETVREVGHELLALPLHFLFVCIYRKGNQRGRMDQVPPPATERLLILMIFLNALQGNGRHPGRKHDIYPNGHEDQERASATTAQHTPNLTMQHLRSSQC